MSRALSNGTLVPARAALLEQEEPRKADQGDAVMPSRPAAQFILSHAEFAFGVWETAFDPEPLGLHAGETLPRGVGGGVAQ